MSIETHRMGELERRDGRYCLTFRRKLAHAPENVWRAITEPDHLAVWFPWEMHGELRAGAPMRFVSREMGSVVVEGRMLEFDPPRLMEFVWSDDERLRFELEPDGSGCILTLSNTFDEVGKAARDAAGWHACLDVLVAHLGEGGVAF